MSNPITVAPSNFHLVSVACGDYVNLAWDALTPPAGEGPLSGYTIAWDPARAARRTSSPWAPGRPR